MGICGIHSESALKVQLKTPALKINEEVSGMLQGERTFDLDSI
jgi:hypothetical protein